MDERGEKSVRRAALLTATMGAFLTPFMGSSINVALPAIAREFSMSALLLVWIPTSFLLSSAVFLMPFGKIADMYGKKRVFLLGSFLYAVSSFLSGIAPSSLFLIFFRLLQGAGGAMLFGTGVAIISSVFPPGERGRALGITTASTYIGLSTGPFIGGFLTHHLGWRSIFFLNSVLAGVTFLAVIVKLKTEWVENRDEKFDIKGALFYGILLTCFMLGFSFISKKWGSILLAFGVAGVHFFIRMEEKEKFPMLNINLFRKNRTFTFSNLATFIHYSASYALGFLLSLYLQLIKGFDSRIAGLVLMARPVTMAIFSPFAGMASDTTEPRILASSGMALTAVCFFLFLFLNPETSLYFVLFLLVLHGVGFALFASPNTNAVMSSVERKNYGIASASLATMRLTGQMFSMGIATLIMGMVAGTQKIEPQTLPLLMKTIKLSMGVSTILCTLGTFASLARGNIIENDHS